MEKEIFEQLPDGAKLICRKSQIGYDGGNVYEMDERLRRSGIPELFDIYIDFSAIEQVSSIESAVNELTRKVKERMDFIYEDSLNREELNEEWNNLSRFHNECLRLLRGYSELRRR